MGSDIKFLEHELTILRMLQVQELSSPPRACHVVTECIRVCMNTTYSFLFDHCHELFVREYSSETLPGGSLKGDGVSQHVILCRYTHNIRVACICYQIMSTDRQTKRVVKQVSQQRYKTVSVVFMQNTMHLDKSIVTDSLWSLYN